MPNGKPNILVIWGDDIGITNLSCYSDGLMGYRTPNIDRIADEGMRFTDSYGEQSCTAGRASFITGPERVPHRPQQGRDAGGRYRPAAGGPHDRRSAEAARLRHRPVRQEPPRRPERVPADRARIRRVLRQPLPPERRGGARAPRTGRTPEEFPAFNERARPRGVIHSWATDEDDDTEDERYGRAASSASRTPARSRRSAWRRSTRSSPRRRRTSSGARANADDPVLRVDEHHAHALPHAPQAREHRAGGSVAVASTTTR